MNDIDINLERFANFMADMIEKYGAEIDLSELDDAKAETSVSASFILKLQNFKLLLKMIFHNYIVLYISARGV